jgi:hypothetical protein
VELLLLVLKLRNEPELALVVFPVVLVEGVGLEELVGGSAEGMAVGLNLWAEACDPYSDQDGVGFAVELGFVVVVALYRQEVAAQGPDLDAAVTDHLGH